MKGAAPAGVGEEVDRDVGEPGQLISDACLIFLIVGSLEGPVVEEWAAQDVFARNETPEARIEAGMAMVTHHEVFAWRNDDVAILKMVRQIDHPRCYRAVRVFHSGQDGREVVEVGLIAGDDWRVEPVFGHGLRDTIDEDGAVAQVYVIAGHADETLDEGEIDGIAVGVGFGLRRGTIEDDDVAALGIAMVDQRHPAGAGKKCDAIAKQMIADHQGVFHRAGGNCEILADKSENEQPDDEDGADAGEGFEGSFIWRCSR